MRKLVAGCLIVVGCVSACAERSVQDQARQLGAAEFTAAGWSTATHVQRGAMVASFLEKHDPERMSRQDIIRLLGTPTGYHEYDEDPAYVVGPATVESRSGTGYLLVFLTDKRSGKVADVLFVPEVRNQPPG